MILAGKAAITCSASMRRWFVLACFAGPSPRSLSLLSALLIRPSALSAASVRVLISSSSDGSSRTSTRPHHAASISEAKGASSKRTRRSRPASVRTCGRGGGLLATDEGMRTVAREVDSGKRSCSTRSFKCMFPTEKQCKSPHFRKSLGVDHRPSGNPPARFSTRSTTASSTASFRRCHAPSPVESASSVLSNTIARARRSTFLSSSFSVIIADIDVGRRSRETRKIDCGYPGRSATERRWPESEPRTHEEIKRAD